jgi:hypothetical protein
MGLLEMEQRARGEVPASPKPRRGTIWLALAIAAAGGGLIYLILIQPKIDHDRLSHQHGTARGSVIARDTVIVIDTVSIANGEEIERSRLTAIDIKTGKQLAQIMVPGFGTCVVATSELLWCDLGALELYDARTLARVANVEKEIDKAKLGNVRQTKETGATTLVGIVEGARATLLLDDGHVAIYDATVRKLSKSDSVPRQLATERHPALSLPGLGLCSERSGGRATVGSSSEMFLAPKVLGLDPPVFLHHTSLDQHDDKLQLSRLDPSGKLRWTIDLGRGGCEHMELDSHRLVIATTNPGHRAVAVDLEKGTALWTASF